MNPLSIEIRMRVENLAIVQSWFSHFLIGGKGGMPPLPKVRAGR